MERDKKQKRRFFKRFSYFPFEGKIFRVLTDASGNGWHLGVLDPMVGLVNFFEYWNHDSNGRYSARAVMPHAVPVGENVLATGKIVAKNYVQSADCNLIHAIEVITSKGIGYIERIGLYGPIGLDENGKVKLLAS